MAKDFNESEIKALFIKAVKEKIADKKAGKDNVLHEHEAEDYMNTILRFAKASKGREELAKKAIEPILIKQCLKGFRKWIGLPGKDEKDAFNEMRERFFHFCNLPPSEKEQVSLLIKKERE